MDKRAEDQAEDDGPALEQFVGYNLKRAYMIVQSDFTETLSASGLSTRLFSTLTLVVQCPGVTQSALARKLGIERSGLVAIIDELERRDYLRRVSVPGDRRAQALSPTGAGARAAAEAIAAVQRHEAALLSMLSAEEKAALLATLRKIRGAGEGDA